MSEGRQRALSYKRRKRCKSEFSTSKKPVPTKRRRRVALKRALKDNEPDLNVSNSAEPPMRFSIQVKVESCDEEWYEEETLKEDADSKRLLGNQNESNEECSVKKKTEKQKSNKLKFAYLEALHENGVREELEGSSTQFRRQSVSEPENFKGLRNSICEETFGNLCIKKEVLEEDQVSSENLAEYLGITIKDEPLPEPIDEAQELTNANQTHLCLEDLVESTKHKEKCMEIANYNDSEEESVHVTSGKLTGNLGITIKERLLNNPNQSNEECSRNRVKKKTEKEKSNKLKLAYLEALHKNRVFEKLESSTRLRTQGVMEPENFKDLGNNICEENFEALCIRNEVLEKDQVSSENLTEYLGITIKDEPEPIHEAQELTDANQTQPCLKVDSVESTKYKEKCMEMANYNDSAEERAHEGPSESPKPWIRRTTYEFKSNFLSAHQGTPDPDYGSELPSWHINSTYFDLAMNNLLQSSHDMAKKRLKFVCRLCGQTFNSLAQGSRATEACVQHILTHLNYHHLHDALVLSVAHPTETCTIFAEKASVSDANYAELLTAARIETQLTKTFLQSIVNVIRRFAKGRHKRLHQILSYKCYMCKLCYQYLGHFVGHLKATHAVRDLHAINISTEAITNAFINVIAFQTTPVFKHFPVITDDSNKPTYKCLLCKVDFGSNNAAYVEHSDIKLKCSGCRRIYYCHELHAHIGRCSSFFQKTYPKTCPCKEVFDTVATLDKHQKHCQFGHKTLAFTCLVCSFVATTIDILQDHQWYSHTVRSDEFVFSNDFFKRPLAKCQQASSKTRKRSSDGVIKEAKDTNSHRSVQSYQQARPLGFNTNTQPTITKSLRKIRNTLRKSSNSTSLSRKTCPICPFRPSWQLKAETLEEHMVTCHLVRSDIKMTPTVTCTWCSFSFVSMDAVSDESLLSKHTVKNHRVNYSVVQYSSCNIGDFCLICAEICREKSLESHLKGKHKVRSDYRIHQDVTTCGLCLIKYAGPVDSHHCPKRLDFVCCPYCWRQFQNYHFLSCHLKGEKPLPCTNCHQVLRKGCMRASHEAFCRGDHTVVHECLKCGFKEDEMSAIVAHRKDCFTIADCVHRVFFFRGLIIPKIGVSTDPRNDHSYAKKPIPAVAKETTELTAQNSEGSVTNVSNILCTEVYEDTDLESSPSEVKDNGWHTAVTKLQKLVDSDVTKNIIDREKLPKELANNVYVTDVPQKNLEKITKLEETEDNILSASPPACIPERVSIGTESNTSDAVSEVLKPAISAQSPPEKIYPVKYSSFMELNEDSLVTRESPKEDGGKTKEVTAVMTTKSKPKDEEEVIVIKTTEIDAQLGVEDLIENNEVAETESGDGFSKLEGPLKKTCTCFHCLFKGSQGYFSKYLKSCSRVGKTHVTLTSLPYNCIDYCQSFKCYVCWAEHPTLDEYFTHKCERIGS